MAPPVWATDEQLVRLNGFLPTYLEHGERNNYPECWPKLFIPWFESWPAGPIPLPNLDATQPTPAIIQTEGRTAKQITAAKAKAKRDADWQGELTRVRAMDETQRAAWCLGQGIEKQKRVCGLHDTSDNKYINARQFSN